MYRIFRRTRIKVWELAMVRNVLMELPGEFSSFLNQITDGQIKGVRVSHRDTQEVVTFKFNRDVFKKYYNESFGDFKLTNIKVYDTKTSTYLACELYFTSGLMIAYSLEGNKKHKIDVNKVDTSGFRKVFWGESDYNRLFSLLDEEEKRLIKPSEFYSVFVANKEYFHIKDLEDGDFVGLDINKRVYKITHDPMEVVLLDMSIIDVLKA